MAALAGLLVAGMAGAATADPVGTKKLNGVRSEQPRIRVIGASTAGTLYQVSRVGDSTPATTWVKPAGAPAYQTGFFSHLAGDKLYREGAGTNYQLIGDTQTRTCPPGTPAAADDGGIDPSDIAFLAVTPFGWIGRYGERVDVSASGCTVSTPGYPSGGLIVATGPNGYLITPESPTGDTVAITYVPYSAPAAQVVLADVPRDSVWAFSLSATHAGWAKFNGANGGSAIWQATLGSAGSGHAIGTVPDRVSRTAVAGTSVGWDICSQSNADNCTSGSVTAGGVATTLAGTRTVTSNGSKFVYDVTGEPASIVKAAAVSAAAVKTRVQAVQRLVPVTGSVALGNDRVFYSDGRGKDTLYQRSYKVQDGAVKLGAETTVAPVRRATQVTVEGRSTAYLDAHGDLRLISPNGSQSLAFVSNQEGLRASPDYAMSVTGRWIRWTREQYAGPPCEDGVCEDVYSDQTAMLYDQATGTNTVLGEEDFLPVADGKLYRYDDDLAIVQKDLATGTETVVRPAGSESPLAVDADSQYLVWLSYTGAGYRIGYRNLVTGVVTEGVELGGELGFGQLKVGGSKAAYTVQQPGDQQVRQVRVLDLVTGTSTAVGETRSGFDVSGNALATIGADWTARITPLG
ncbi:hypothetical protein OHA70_05380 [Kribbella sp. NBC_00382]|uniref:hypothetical protein n=1 Tax=Kribbella sp. NBC_00382 TaxID=2975967 RepID=UPI002E1AF7F2